MDKTIKAIIIGKITHKRRGIVHKVIKQPRNTLVSCLAHQIHHGKVAIQWNLQDLQYI